MSASTYPSGKTPHISSDELDALRASLNPRWTCRHRATCPNCGADGYNGVVCLSCTHDESDCEAR
jgi:hypothetical protein